MKFILVLMFFFQDFHFGVSFHVTRMHSCRVVDATVWCSPQVGPDANIGEDPGILPINSLCDLSWLMRVEDSRSISELYNFAGFEVLLMRMVPHVGDLPQAATVKKHSKKSRYWRKQR